MTYEQALEYLASLSKFGMNFGLARIEKLLELMGHPEQGFKSVHITGTNGKGSTTAMLAAILAAGGIKTARYTSPHLSDYTERMTLSGEPVSRQHFAAAIDHTSRFVAEMTAAGWEHPTEFEVLTAAAFHYFSAAGVEYAVIEAGLGGLLDSTNVILPELAIITNVTLEHTDRCGSTVAEIAGHKAGIIKQGAPVVTAAVGEALEVIQAAAEAKEAPLFVAGKDFAGESVLCNEQGQQVRISAGRYGDLGVFSIKLLGRHQAENCALAVMAAQILAETEPRLTRSAMRQALAGVVWPGRFEVIASQPAVILDGAHNPDGARALRLTLDEIFPGRAVVFLLGILADKDVTGITGTLIRAGDTVVVVRPDSPRAAEPAAVAQAIKAARVETAVTVVQGYARARELAGPDGIVCVAGSLYLIGEARAAICRVDKT